MNDIKIFSNPRFGEIRTTIGNNGEPMFCLVDVCKVVGLTNASSVKSRLDREDVQVLDLHALNLTEGNVGNTKANFITESGFYDVLLYSDAPQVKPFRKWVTSEVLPAIRKHGAYATPQTIESMLADPDNAIRLLTALKEERQQRLIAEKKAELEAEINKTNAPKVLFADAVVGSKTTCLIGELAKILTQNGYTIGQNRLFRYLRENGYLGTKGEYYNIPNQKYQEMGLFEVKTSVHDEHGVMVTKRTPKVTGRGQAYFINKFLSL